MAGRKSVNFLFKVVPRVGQSDMCERTKESHPHSKKILVEDYLGSEWIATVFEPNKVWRFAADIYVSAGKQFWILCDW